MKNATSYITKLGILLGILSSIGSCSEIFEGDLGDDTLVVISPSADLETVNTQVQFVWEELEDATSYHLRIAKPDFANLTNLEMDSSIVGNTFQMTLNPGKYEWRLQAKNAITESNTVSGKIHIDSTADLSALAINLFSPADQIYTNQLVQTFSWEEMYNADVYNFKLEHVDTTVLVSNYTSESISMNFTYDGAYTWEVTGKNNLSQTETDPTSRRFIVDTYNPLIPSNLNPVDQASIPLLQGGDSLVTLSWSGEIPETDVAPVKDRFQVSTSNGFQGQTIIYDEELSTSTTAEREKDIKILLPGTYYWRVKSDDEAQNSSDFTAVSSFVVAFTL